MDRGIARTTRRTVALVVAVVALAVTACGSSHRYVANTTSGAYVKLPDDWRTEQFDASGPPSTTSSGQKGLQTWIVYFEKGADPAPEHFAAAAPSVPVGRALVIPLAADERDTVNLVSLRSMALRGTDPLTAAQDETSGVSVLSYADVTKFAGFTGNHIRVRLAGTDATGTGVLDQTALLDAERGLVYVLQVKCAAACFDQHQDEIQRIVDSWYVRKQR